MVHGVIPCTREIYLGITSCASTSVIKWWPMRLHFNWLRGDFGHLVVGSGKGFTERFSPFLLTRQLKLIRTTQTDRQSDRQTIKTTNKQTNRQMDNIQKWRPHRNVSASFNSIQYSITYSMTVFTPYHDALGPGDISDIIISNSTLINCSNGRAKGGFKSRRCVKVDDFQLNS